MARAGLAELLAGAGRTAASRQGRSVCGSRDGTMEGKRGGGNPIACLVAERIMPCSGQSPVRETGATLLPLILRQGTDRSLRWAKGRLARVGR